MTWRHICQFYIIYCNNTIGIKGELRKLSYITACKYSPSKDVNNSWLQKTNIIIETAGFIINTLVTSVFNKLQTARHNDSTWIPKIILNILTPLYVLSHLLPSTTPINTTDIVPFLQVPSFQLGVILRHELDYPDHYNFYFEGYKSMTYSERLASNTIAAASKMEHL